VKKESLVIHSLKLLSPSEIKRLSDYFKKSLFAEAGDVIWDGSMPEYLRSDDAEPEIEKPKIVQVEQPKREKAAENRLELVQENNNLEEPMPLSPVGHLIMGTLKLLTPQETKRLSDKLPTVEAVHEIEEAFPGGVDVESETSEEAGGKLLPLKREAKEEVKEEEQESHHKSPKKRVQLKPQAQHKEDFFEFEDRGVALKREAVILEEVEEEPSTTVFILSEKEKVKVAQQKLQGQRARSIYKKAAASRDKTVDKNDLAHSYSEGVLFDKKK